MIKIVIPGTPVPLQRPRFANGRVYDPQEDLKQDLFWISKYQWPKNDLGMVYQPLKNLPISLTMTFYLPVPGSTPLKKKEALYGQFVIKKPDLDNLVKMVCDYLIQVAYEDDNLVAEISAKKIYDKNPRTEIFIEVLE